MIRVLFFNAFFFLLPFLLYAGWLWRKHGRVDSPYDWTLPTILRLAGAGVVLMTIAIVVSGILHAAPPGGTYKPATIENGQIVPGHIDQQP